MIYLFKYIYVYIVFSYLTYSVFDILCEYDVQDISKTNNPFVCISNIIYATTSENKPIHVYIKS